MTDEYMTYHDLGMRAVAAGWKWQPGAVDIRDGMRMTAAGIPLWHWATAEGDSVDAYAPGNPAPDFRDPATLGILLAQVREAWNEEGIYAYRTHAPDFGGQWSVNSFRLVRGLPQLKRFGTEAEALVAALEAAKERNR